MQRFLILAFAEDTDGLGALGDEYAKHNPVVLASVVCLLAEEVARLTEKSARVLALAVSNRGLAGA
jgi:hypothetical protein